MANKKVVKLSSGVFLLILLMNVFISNIYANVSESPPAADWIFNRTIYDTTGFQIADSIEPTTDGGFFIVGHIIEQQNDNVLAAKIDCDGNLQWYKTFGGSNNDRGRNGQQTNDGGFIIFAQTYSFGQGQGDAWLIKLDSYGNLVWDETYGGNSDDIITSGCQTSDGGYVFSGSVESPTDRADVWLVKTDQQGVIEKEKKYDVKEYIIENDADIATTIKQTADNGYIICGAHFRQTDLKVKAFSMKITSNYDVAWITIYSENFLYSDFQINSVIETYNGYFVAVGSRNYEDEPFNSDFWIWKLKSNGETAWSKSIENSEATDKLFNIKEAPDNGFMMIGVRKYDVLRDVLLIKSDSGGTREWTYQYENAGYQFDENDKIGLALTLDHSCVLSANSKVDGYKTLAVKMEGINDPPTVEIIEPHENQIVSDVCTIRGIADDPNGFATIKKVQVQIDNGVWQEADGTTSWTYQWDTTQFSNDYHNVCARSYDGETYSEIYTIENLYVNNQIEYIEITLSAGWNLITIPKDCGWSAGDLKDNLTCCEYVVKWKADAQSWQWYTGQGFDFILEPGHGYFVYMTYDEVLSVCGDSIAGVDIPLEPGWTLLGWYHEDTTSASNIRDCIPGCEYVVKWVPDSQSWSWYTGQGFNYQINQGMGFFVYMSGESIWNGDC